MNERYMLYPLLRILGHRDADSVLSALDTLYDHTDKTFQQDILSLRQKLSGLDDYTFSLLTEDAMTDDLRCPGTYAVSASQAPLESCGQESV